MKIRPIHESDFDELYRMYRQQTANLPFHHNVRRSQFETDLLTTRFLREPGEHHAKARIGLVATRKNRISAFVGGGMVLRGDEVLWPKMGYIQSIIATPAAVTDVRELLSHVVSHLRRFRPKEIVAQDGRLCPVFFSDSAGCLPSQWAWLGSCLCDAGFEVCGRSLRLVAELGSRRPPGVSPDGFELLPLTHEMPLIEPKFDFAWMLLKEPYDDGDGIVWCGNFFSGAFVKGAAYRSLYMHYFTLMNDAYRGRGLGRLVLQHCLYEAQQRGARYVSLLTDIDNFIAQNLYQSEGFEVVDTMHAFEYKAR